MRRIAIALLAALALGALAQPSAPPAPAPSPPAKIGDVAWLHGYWAGEGMGGYSEEFWTPPRNGVMLGVLRIMKPEGAPNFYEIMAIEEHEQSLVLVVKHFHPGWVGWEEKDKALRLRLRRIAESEAVFGGVTFQRTDAETRTVVVTIRGKDGSRTETFRYKRKAT
jgi:hypothetical protein